MFRIWTMRVVCECELLPYFSWGRVASTYLLLGITIDWCFFLWCAQGAAPPDDDDDDEDDEEEWEEEFFNLFLDDDDEIGFIYGTYEYATHLDKYYNRSEYRQQQMSGLEWVQAKLRKGTACYNMFRMTPAMFHRMHELLVDRYGLKSTQKSTSIEALGMFLWILGAPQSVRQAEDRFERLLGTVHNLFYRVLMCVCLSLLATSLNLVTQNLELGIPGLGTVGSIPNSRIAHSLCKKPTKEIQS